MVVQNNSTIASSTRCIVLCGGENSRWRGYRGVSRKHLVELEGEVLLERTLRLCAAYWPDSLIVVINEGDQELYQSHVVTPCVFSSIPPPSTSTTEAYKLLSSRELWNRGGRTIVFSGDVWFSQMAMEAIFAAADTEWVAFGRAGASRYTGCPYGELFAQSFTSVNEHEHNAVRLDLLYRQGTCTRSAAEWAHYRLMVNGDPNIHIVGDRFVEIDDFTDDFDFPIDYDGWVFGRRIYAGKDPPMTIEEGWGRKDGGSLYDL